MGLKNLAGWRDTEIHGTDGTTVASAARTVFAVNARLRIERLSELAGLPDVVVFDGSIAEATGGDRVGRGSLGRRRGARIVGTKDAKAEVAADGSSSSIILDVR